MPVSSEAVSIIAEKRVPIPVLFIIVVFPNVIARACEAEYYGTFDDFQTLLEVDIEHSEPCTVNLIFEKGLQSKFQLAWLI